MANWEASCRLDHSSATELLNPGVTTPILDENFDVLIALAVFYGPQVISFSNHESELLLFQASITKVLFGPAPSSKKYEWVDTPQCDHM